MLKKERQDVLHVDLKSHDLKDLHHPLPFPFQTHTSHYSTSMYWLIVAYFEIFFFLYIFNINFCNSKASFFVVVAVIFLFFLCFEPVRKDLVCSEWTHKPWVGESEWKDVRVPSHAHEHLNTSLVYTDVYTEHEYTSPHSRKHKLWTHIQKATPR